MKVTFTNGEHTFTHIDKEATELIMEALIKYSSTLNGKINHPDRTDQEREQLKQDRERTRKLYRAIESSYTDNMAVNLVDATEYQEEEHRI